MDGDSWSARVLGVQARHLLYVQAASLVVYLAELPVLSTLAGVLAAAICVALLPFMRRICVRHRPDGGSPPSEP